MSTGFCGLKLSALLAICQVIDKTLDLESVLEEVLEILSRRLSMQRATVTLYDKEADQLFINASYGLSPEEKRRGVYRLDEGVTGRIFKTGEACLVPDIRKEPLFLDRTGARKIARGKMAFVGAPILLHGEAIGVLTVDRLFPDGADLHEDVDFLKVVATLIASFISLNRQVRAREASLRRENVSLKSRISRDLGGPRIVGDSLAMLDVQRQLEKVAPTKATVLLLGESGVGKTLIARIIHQLSERDDHPFIKVNCAAIPENLLESELFGYERGAFTGAVGERPGRFEEADKGSIFLDEIGELPLLVQSKLLRVLQDKELERLGGNRTRKVDVRILAATNRDLGKLVEDGGFRLDLYYRLSVFPIKVPALRERREDIPGLLNHFIAKMNQAYGRTLSFSNKALDRLVEYDWPGNVREMENLIERLVIISDNNSRIERDIVEAHLVASRRDSISCGQTGGGPSETEDHAPEVFSPAGPSLIEIERKEVVSALERNNWIQYKAGDELGLTPRQMGYRVRKFGLEGLIARGRAAVRRKKRAS